MNDAVSVPVTVKHRLGVDDGALMTIAFDKFERFERRVDGLEGELDAMALGREKTGLAAEIDALASDDALNDELEALRQSMKTEEVASSNQQ